MIEEESSTVDELVLSVIWERLWKWIWEADRG
jgi:hypothetical protein